jgi:hypothetical protein
MEEFFKFVLIWILKLSLRGDNFFTVDVYICLVLDMDNGKEHETLTNQCKGDRNK